MIKMKDNNQIVKNINKIVKCEIYYDADRFTLFVYTLNATKEQIQKIKNVFADYVDRTNSSITYEKLTIYS